MKITLLLVAAIFLSSGTYAQTSAGGTNQQANSAKPNAAPLANEDILKLTQADLGDDVIVAKINGAAQVAFHLETDDLIALKKAGISPNVIAAMIKRSDANNATSAVSPSNIVPAPAPPVLPTGLPGADDVLIQLMAKDGTTNLTSIEGHMATTFAYVTTLIFSDFPGLKADVRTKDSRPYILVSSRKSPQGRFYLVRCEPNEKDGDRSVKQGRHGLFSNKDLGAPDTDWTIPFEVKAVQPGLWRMDPREDLKPGEYGLYGGRFGMAELYDFGVDN